MRKLPLLLTALLAACGGTLDHQPHTSAARDMAAADMRDTSELPDAPDASPDLAADMDAAEDLGPDLALDMAADMPPDMATDMAPDMPPPPGELLAEQVRLTYYWLAREADYAGAPEAVLYDSTCQPLATVSNRFSDAICIEGSGKLDDGRVLNYARTCDCGRPCPTGGIICYASLDPAAFPWGKGNRNNALIPMRSIATDRALIPSGTVLYAPEFDGVVVPDAGDVTGFVHDGCLRADDVGGAIQGAHIDMFAGEAAVRRALEQVRPTNTRLTLYRAHPDRCAALR